MRPKNKIEKYLDRLIKKYDGKVTESLKSRYYKIGNQHLRVSNHIAMESSGLYSIIFDKCNKDNYIVYNKSTGEATVLNYNKTKEFVRNYFIMLSLVGIPKASVKDDIETIFNTLQNILTTNQFNQLKSWLQQVKNKN